MIQESAVALWMARRFPLLARSALWAWGQYYGRSGKTPHWLFMELGNALQYRVPITVALPNGQKLRIPINDTTGQEIRRKGFAERASMDLLTLLLKDGGVFFDLGAHVGQFTVVAGKVVGPRGAVHSFEPDEETFRWLCGNVTRNELRNVTLNRMAVCEETGEREFYLGTVEAIAASSLRPPRGASGEVISVPTTSLDDYCAQRRIDFADFVKIDVEGAELDVLRGARSLLSRKRLPVIHIEFHPYTQRAFGRTLEQLRGALEEYEFKLLRMTDNGPREFWLAEEEPTVFNVLAVSDAVAGKLGF